MRGSSRCLRTYATHSRSRGSVVDSAAANSATARSVSNVLDSHTRAGQHVLKIAFRIPRKRHRICPGNGHQGAGGVDFIDIGTPTGEVRTKIDPAPASTVLAFAAGSGIHTGVTLAAEIMRLGTAHVFALIMGIAASP